MSLEKLTITIYLFKMERYIIGKCRNGKIVTSRPELDNLSSPEEIFDAIVMFDFLAAREFRKYGDTSIVAELTDAILLLRQILDKKSSYCVQMDALGAKTLIELVPYARTLLAPEFRD